MSAQSCRHISTIFGGYSGRVTPDPIPNSEVKPASADGTARETVWESRTPPELSQPPHFGEGAIFLTLPLLPILGHLALHGVERPCDDRAVRPLKFKDARCNRKCVLKGRGSRRHSMRVSVNTHGVLRSNTKRLSTGEQALGLELLDYDLS